MPVPPAADQRIPRSLLRDGVYLRLRDAIVDGTLAPGEQLRDAELAAWLGVSRTPVREALLRLGQAGLVQARPGRSTTVAQLDPLAVREAAAVVAAMHRLAVTEAVDRLTEDDLAAMREANDRFAAALQAGDVDGALAADDRFHAVPVEASANRAAATVLEQFSPVLRRLERLRFSSATASASVARHARFVELCATKQTERAANLAHETWHSLESLLQTVTTDNHPSSIREKAR